MLFEIAFFFSGFFLSNVGKNEDLLSKLKIKIDWEVNRIDFIKFNLFIIIFEGFVREINSDFRCCKRIKNNYK